MMPVRLSYSMRLRVERLVSVDWDADDVPANPEPPTGVIVDERDAKC